MSSLNKTNLHNLRKMVCEANINLVKNKLVILTWGNASAVDRDNDLMIIKPSGVPYEQLTPNKMVILKISTGEVVNKQSLLPSSDAPTHLALYRKYGEINSIIHTHSPYATAFAQANKKIVSLGTTHADYFYGDILCTRKMTKAEIQQNYEYNTGKVIIEMLSKN
ncbi:MAG: class II aldolase/adducin family protein, partial [Mycoplasmataceae bacterium]|nr:class II aldolase/adducin family protein [Mycoplasmataceae bacterium]